jgi:WD40 repeat protein
MISGKTTSSVFGFSSDTHELIDYFQAQQDEMITCMDAIILGSHIASDKNLNDADPIFAYGTSTEEKGGRVLFRKNWTATPLAVDLSSPATVLRFSPNNQYIICGTADGNVHLIKVTSEGKIRVSDRQPYVESRETPLSINFSDNNHDTEAIVTMDTRRHYKFKIDNPGKLQELEEKQTYSISLANIVYHNQVHLLPVVIGQELEYIISARSQTLEVWKSVRDLETGCSIKVNGHSSDIFKIEVASSKDYAYSLGLDDNCLIEWKMEYDFLHKADLSSSPIQSNSELRKQSAVQSPEDQDDLLRIHRELTFCQNIGEKALKYRDSFTMFRGTTARVLNALNNKATRGIDDREDFMSKRVPEISLTLNHVYGIEVFNRRKTLFFLHYYSIKEKSKATDPTQTGPQPEMKDLILPENYLKEMLFSKYTPIPYDQRHVNCERFIAYFSSRVAVVAKCTSGAPKQKFYEGHRARISCMAVHPSKMIVATGEAEAAAEIHVWSMIDCCLMKKVASLHANGVVNLAFSFDGFYLISLGLSGKYA